MMRIKVLLSVLLISSLLFDCFAQSKTFSEVDKAFKELNDKRAFNGSVLVAKNGKIIYQNMIGFADMEHGVPINRDTKFELASLSKPFTALLVLQLVEKGKLKLEAKVSDYIPEFRRSDSGEITIHHLLSHTSGLQDFVGLYCPFAEWREKEFLEGLQNTPVNFSYYTSDNSIKAQILVTNMKGSVLKAFNLAKGAGQVNIKSGELAAGTYNYTLYVNDSKIETKQMIIAK